MATALAGQPVATAAAPTAEHLQALRGLVGRNQRVDQDVVGVSGHITFLLHLPEHCHGLLGLVGLTERLDHGVVAAGSGLRLNTLLVPELGKL